MVVWWFSTRSVAGWWACMRASNVDYSCSQVEKRFRVVGCKLSKIQMNALHSQKGHSCQRTPRLARISNTCFELTRTPYASHFILLDGTLWTRWRSSTNNYCLYPAVCFLEGHLDPCSHPRHAHTSLQTLVVRRSCAKRSEGSFPHLQRTF